MTRACVYIFEATFSGRLACWCCRLGLPCVLLFLLLMLLLLLLPDVVVAHGVWPVLMR